VVSELDVSRPCESGVQTSRALARIWEGRAACGPPLPSLTAFTLIAIPVIVIFLSGFKIPIVFMKNELTIAPLWTLAFLDIVGVA
jgi:hypothetical protein